MFRLIKTWEEIYLFPDNLDILIRAVLTTPPTLAQVAKYTNTQTINKQDRLGMAGNIPIL